MGNKKTFGPAVYSRIKIHKESQGVCVMYMCSNWGKVTYRKTRHGKVTQMRICVYCAKKGGLIDGTE